MRTKVIDRSKCQGCKNCELACVAVHADSLAEAYAQGPQNGPRSRNKVELDEHGRRFPEFCRHCPKPACVEACMAGALTKREDGYVLCDTNRCVGCYMCVMSCPYGMARPAIAGRRKMFKCDGCVDRSCMACVAACPSGCLSVREGDRAIEFKE